MSYIISELRGLHTSDLLYLLQYGEAYYYIAYMLMDVYMNTRFQKIGEVLPLSIVEPYHSERIRAQHGAFSLFPYYGEDSYYKTAKNMGIWLDAMENMYQADQYLYQICLSNPSQIAYEIKNLGLNVSWLYPEMPVVANTIEQREILN